MPHRHITFTIPKRMRVFLRYDRALNDVLFEAAWSALRECLGEGGVPGVVLTVLSVGEALNPHPHLHGIMADGIFREDGGFAPFGELDQAKLTRSFAQGVLVRLRQKELIADRDVAQILSQQYTGFSVWVGEPFEDKDRTLFVARYIERCSLSQEKLSIDEDTITYTTNDGRAHACLAVAQRRREFDALEFLALLSVSIPKPGESVIRYFPLR